MISQDRLQKSLTYLAETDESHATAKALMKGLEKQEKTIKGQAFLATAGQGTIAEREAKAYTSQEYIKWRQSYEDAVCDFEILNNKRSREILVIEVWRSLNASRRQGNVT